MSRMELICIDLGATSYDHALAVQHQLVAQVQSRPDATGFLLLVEHDPPAITMGRRGGMHDVRVARERLAAMGVDVRTSRRGGQVTWHGRGQLAAYAIVRVGGAGPSVREHMRSLQDAVVLLASRMGISAAKAPGNPGVWVGDEKMAAVGVAVSRWVTYHGVAVNVAADLGGFDLIVPCGLADGRVTSLSRVLGRNVTVEEVKRPLVECLRETLGFRSVRHAAAASPSIL